MCDDSPDIIDGLLWSDPSEMGMFTPNVRGCGYAFGPRATSEFLANNSLKMIVRAHQLAQDGWSWEHDQKVLTIFSAPNYCGINNNKGGIMIVRGGQTSLEPNDLTLVNYDSVEDATPLFAPCSPASLPKPSANAAGGYFAPPAAPGSPTNASSPTAPTKPSDDSREALL
jgi:serine/threonine-protein phosphatase 2A catalytic subunit